MYTSQTVDNLLNQYKSDGLTKAEIVWKIAEACLGWPYVFGAVGELCTVDVRKKYYNNYINSKPAEAAKIKERCSVLSGRQTSCTGCQYYPGGPVRCFDCRGFTRKLLAMVDISLQGAGATSQWNNENNWVEKGEIRDLPDGVLACFFHKDGNVMQHTGFALSGQTIHCSGTVKRGKTTDKGVTHYAIPKGLNEKPTLPTIRRGSRGDYVKYAQKLLQDLKYNIGSSGVDGIFGAKTEAAVKAFQKDWGLTEDGVVGPATWERLTTAPAPEKFYTAMIKHLDKTQAAAMKLAYPNCEIIEE